KAEESKTWDPSAEWTMVRRRKSLASILSLSRRERQNRLRRIPKHVHLQLIFQCDSVKDFAKAPIAPEWVKHWIHAHLQRKPVGFLRHFRQQSQSVLQLTAFDVDENVMRRRHVLATRAFCLQLFQLPFAECSHRRIESCCFERLLENSRIFTPSVEIQRRAPMRDRLVRHASLCANVSEVLVRSSVVRVKVECFRQLGGGAIVLTTEKEQRPVMHVSPRKKWVELNSALCLGDRFVESSEIRQAHTIMRVEVTE